MSYWSKEINGTLTADENNNFFNSRYLTSHHDGRVDGILSTLTMRSIYAQSLFFSAAATLDELLEAVTMLEDTERTARRVLGGAHPTTVDVGVYLHNSRAALRASETP